MAPPTSLDRGLSSTTHDLVSQSIGLAFASGNALAPSQALTIPIEGTSDQINVPSFRQLTQVLGFEVSGTSRFTMDRARRWQLLATGALSYTGGAKLDQFGWKVAVGGEHRFAHMPLGVALRLGYEGNVNWLPHADTFVQHGLIGDAEINVELARPWSLFASMGFVVPLGGRHQEASPLARFAVGARFTFGEQSQAPQRGDEHSQAPISTQVSLRPSNDPALGDLQAAYQALLTPTLLSWYDTQLTERRQADGEYDPQQVYDILAEGIQWLVIADRPWRGGKLLALNTLKRRVNVAIQVIRSEQTSHQALAAANIIGLETRKAGAQAASTMLTFLTGPTGLVRLEIDRQSNALPLEFHKRDRTNEILKDMIDSYEVTLDGYLKALSELSPVIHDTPNRQVLLGEVGRVECLLRGVNCPSSISILQTVPGLREELKGRAQPEPVLPPPPAIDAGEVTPQSVPPVQAAVEKRVAHTATHQPRSTPEPLPVLVPPVEAEPEVYLPAPIPQPTPTDTAAEPLDDSTAAPIRPAEPAPTIIPPAVDTVVDLPAAMRQAHTRWREMSAPLDATWFDQLIAKELEIEVGDLREDLEVLSIAKCLDWIETQDAAKSAWTDAGLPAFGTMRDELRALITTIAAHSQPGTYDRELIQLDDDLKSLPTKLAATMRDRLLGSNGWLTDRIVPRAQRMRDTLKQSNVTFGDASVALIQYEMSIRSVDDILARLTRLLPKDAAAELGAAKNLVRCMIDTPGKCPDEFDKGLTLPNIVQRVQDLDQRK